MEEVGQPLIDRGKSMLDQLLRIAQTRLEMVSIEIQREKLELARTIRMVIAMAVCAWLAGFALILWVALVLPREQRAIFLGSLFGLFVVISVACAVALRRRATRPPLFKRLVTQLELDRTSLGPDA